jgi:hypothetical protein
MTLKKKFDRDDLGRFKAKLAAKAKSIKDNSFTVESLLDKADDDGFFPGAMLVRVSSKNVPACGEDYDGAERYDAFKLSDEYLLLTEICDYGDGSCNLTYSTLKAPKRYNDANFPSDFKLYKVTDSKVLDQYAEYCLKHLEDQLDHHWEIG